MQHDLNHPQRARNSVTCEKQANREYGEGFSR